MIVEMEQLKKEKEEFLKKSKIEIDTSRSLKCTYHKNLDIAFAC